jgi:hypothetical protein
MGGVQAMTDQQQIALYINQLRQDGYNIQIVVAGSKEIVVASK